MQVRMDDIEQFGGLEALQARVDKFKEALEAHKLTADQPAPAEMSLVELLARNNFTIEPYEPAPVRGSPPDTISAVNLMNASVHALTMRLQQLETQIGVSTLPVLQHRVQELEFKVNKLMNDAKNTGK